MLEVETPALSAAAITDPQLASFGTLYSGPGPRYGQMLYLHTSPEFPMKRLLAAGSGCISVSYTHLDVYKRQNQGLAEALPTGTLAG